MIKEVAFVVIAVTDLARARKFYEETLELKRDPGTQAETWVEYEIGSATVAIGSHPAFPPSRDGTAIAFEVDDIDQTIAKLKDRGVVFEMDKMETPVCWMAMFRDPDGNKLMVHKRKAA